MKHRHRIPTIVLTILLVLAGSACLPDADRENLEVLNEKCPRAFREADTADADSSPQAMGAVDFTPNPGARVHPWRDNQGEVVAWTKHEDSAGYVTPNCADTMPPYPDESGWGG